MGQQRLAAAGLLKGRTIAIDATTLEANAAMRSIVRRDTGEAYQAYLTRLAAASGIKTPTREVLARFDRKRKKKTSNSEWTSPSDPDAKVAKMKDGQTHLAHKAEHAVDLESGALVAVTVQGADQGDTRTLITTAITAAEQVEAAHATTDAHGRLEEIVADKGYHSNETMVDLAAVGLRSYISEPDRGRRDWSDAPDAYAPVHGNRRRLRGARGRRLRRRRAELAERSFAHLYETGGMRRTPLAGTRQHLEASAHSWRRLQLGARDAPVPRHRHATALAGPRRRASWPSSSPYGRASALSGGTMSQDSLIDRRGRRRVIVLSCYPSPRESQGLNTD